MDEDTPDDHVSARPCSSLNIAGMTRTCASPTVPFVVAANRRWRYFEFCGGEHCAPMRDCQHAGASPSSSTEHRLTFRWRRQAANAPRSGCRCPAICARSWRTPGTACAPVAPGRASDLRATAVPRSCRPAVRFAGWCAARDRGPVSPPSETSAGPFLPPKIQVPGARIRASFLRRCGPGSFAASGCCRPA